jgi:hypothetical protein
MILVTFLLFTSVSLAIVTLRLKGQLRQANLNKPNFIKLLKQSDFVDKTETLLVALSNNSVYVGRSSKLVTSEVYSINYTLGCKMAPLQDYENEVFTRMQLKLRAAENFQKELAQLEAQSELTDTLIALDKELAS